MTWIRALAAAGLSVVLPGAGHALIRDWIRALLFAGLFVSAVALFFPTEQMLAAETVGGASEVVFEEMATIDQFVITFIVLFAAIDATFRSLGYPPNASSGGDGPSCPNCGKELDADLEFCHWCTARLDGAEEEPAN